MKILLADDDRDLVDWLSYALRRDGDTVSTAFTGDVAVRAVRTDPPDIVILDLVFPPGSGLDVLRQIRSYSEVPVIFLTAVRDSDRIVEGLQSGADDYVVKPFQPRELKARAEAVLRRSRAMATAKEMGLSTISCGEITLDPRKQAVTIAGQQVHLTPTEFEVLQYLMVNQGVVVRLPDILSNVWGYDADQEEDVVRLAISRLRRKIEPDPAHPRYIHNVPGHGYMISAPR